MNKQLRIEKSLMNNIIRKQKVVKTKKDKLEINHHKYEVMFDKEKICQCLKLGHLRALEVSGRPRHASNLMLEVEAASVG